MVKDIFHWVHAVILLLMPTMNELFTSTVKDCSRSPFEILDYTTLLK